MKTKDELLDDVTNIMRDAAKTLPKEEYVIFLYGLRVSAALAKKMSA